MSSNPAMAGPIGPFSGGATPHANGGGPTDTPPISKSFARQAFDDTFRDVRARIGAVWIVVLAFLGVFAPFLANSHPLAMRVNGTWSSPLVRNLTQMDVTLIVTFFVAVVVTFVRPLRWPQRLAIIAWVAGITLPLTYVPVLRVGIAWWWVPVLIIDLAMVALIPYALRVSGTIKVAMGVLAIFIAAALVLFPVRPPENVDFSSYRERLRQGQIEAARYVPIPFSAGDRQRDIRDARLQPPSREHWMGTETNGADVASHIIHASRIALAIGFISTGIAVVIGVIIGAIMGYFVGRTDMIGMRLIEIFEAVPTLVLLLTFVAFFGRNLYLMMAIIGLVTWTGDARFVRAEFLRLRKQDFVQAAIATGLPLRSILFRHMLPNALTPVLVGVSFGVASAILYEAILSFLGLGLVDEPSWGQLLNQVTGSAGGTFKWWLALFPGLMIFLTVYAYNLVGESLRDALDPKLRGVK